MKKNLLKIGLIYLFTLILVLIIINLSPDQLLKVNFLDVGQGDAILIKSPFGQNILIDGGGDQKVLKEVGKVLPFWDRTIDLIILSHPHDDHLLGLIEVIKRYRVKKIIYSGVIYESDNYEAWRNLIIAKKIPLFVADKKSHLLLGVDCFLDFIYPADSLNGLKAENVNNSSLVIKLTYKKINFLFTGDIEEEVEKKLIKNQDLKNINIYKAPHHGSDTSSDKDFLNLIKPQLAIISVGQNNSFSHPSPRTLLKLERLGTKIFRTDELGAILIKSDGAKIFY